MSKRTLFLTGFWLLCGAAVAQRGGLRQSVPSRIEGNRFTVEEAIRLSHFGDPYTLSVDPVKFSPDGRYFVVVTERGLLSQNQPESTLRVYSTEAVRQFLLHPKTSPKPPPVWTLRQSTHKEGPIVTDVKWVPDSKAFAFLVKTSGGNRQLLFTELNAKALRALTPPDQNVTVYDIRRPDAFAYAVRSPAVREKALARATSIIGTGRPLVGLLFPEKMYSSTSAWTDLSDLWAVVNGKRIQVKDKSSGRPFSLYRDGQDALALSPDGRFVVTARAVDTIPPEWETLYPPPSPSSAYRIRAGRQDLTALEGGRYVSEYVLIDLTRGNSKSLTNAPIGGAAGWWGATDAAWSGDGKSVALSNTFIHEREEGGESEAKEPCVVVVDLERKAQTCLERLRASENGKYFVEKIWFSPGSHQQLMVKGLSGGPARYTSYIQARNGSWAQVTTSESTLAGQKVNIEVKEDMNTPPVLVATDTASRASQIILDPNPQLKTIHLIEASVYKWKDKSGRDWVGSLYKPPGYSRDERYPLVIHTHGFLENQFRPSGMYPTAYAAQELAGAGFVVLQTRCPSSLAVAATPDELPCNVAGYEAAVQHLVADGLVDQDRVGIIGFSRTCSYVMKALTASTLHFKAASITDGLTMGYGQYILAADMGNNATAHETDAMIGAPPFGQGLQPWLKESPEFNMQNVKTPLLVVGLGRASTLFMWEPYAALRYLRKPVELIVLNTSEHVLTNPGARMISQGGTVDWFRFWLQGYEDRDPAKAGQYKRWRELRKLQEKNEASGSKK